ncbi:MAG: hypothetical protein Q9184_005002 [Pyrenodesmia sp. 2 TL-2023]
MQHERHYDVSSRARITQERDDLQNENTILHRRMLALETDLRDKDIQISALTSERDSLGMHQAVEECLKDIRRAEEVKAAELKARDDELKARFTRVYPGSRTRKAMELAKQLARVKEGSLSLFSHLFDHSPQIQTRLDRFSEEYRGCAEWKRSNEYKSACHLICRHVAAATSCEIDDNLVRSMMHVHSRTVRSGYSVILNVSRYRRGNRGVCHEWCSSRNRPPVDPVTHAMNLWIAVLSGQTWIGKAQVPKSE